METLQKFFKEVRGDSEQRQESPFLPQTRPFLQIKCCWRSQDPMVQAAPRSTHRILSSFSLFLRHRLASLKWNQWKWQLSSGTSRDKEHLLPEKEEHGSSLGPLSLHFCKTDQLLGHRRSTRRAVHSQGTIPCMPHCRFHTHHLVNFVIVF